jgi:hypothetical protein
MKLIDVPMVTVRAAAQHQRSGGMGSGGWSLANADSEAAAPDNQRRG